MTATYKQRFELVLTPFPKDAHGKTFFCGRGGYDRLGRAFRMLLEEPGLGILTADSGVGKTAGIRNLTQALPRPQYRDTDDRDGGDAPALARSHSVIVHVEGATGEGGAGIVDAWRDEGDESRFEERSSRRVRRGGTRQARRTVGYDGGVPLRRVQDVVTRSCVVLETHDLDPAVDGQDSVSLLTQY